MESHSQTAPNVDLQSLYHSYKIIPTVLYHSFSGWKVSIMKLIKLHAVYFNYHMKIHYIDSFPPILNREGHPLNLNGLLSIVATECYHV